jgi:Family of unknown function (DUF6159)
MGRLKRGLALAGQSWEILRSNRSLLAFPLLGAALAVVIVGPPALAAAYLVDRGDTVPGAMVGAVAIYLLCFITAYIGVGLAVATDGALRDQPVSLSGGLRVASGKLGAITGWALINAILSIVLRALEMRSELAGIAAALVGGAWSVISLLAIPAIALEDAGPVTAIKRSATLFKEHWGGRIVGMAAIGFGVFLLVMLPAVAIGVVGVVVLSDSGSAGVGAGAVLIGLGAILFAVGVILSSALQQIFAVVLYRYTTSGEALGGFTAEDLEGSLRVRGAVAQG